MTQTPTTVPPAKPGPAKKAAAAPVSQPGTDQIAYVDGVAYQVDDVIEREGKKYRVQRDVLTGNLWAVELGPNADPPIPVPGPVDLNEPPPRPMPLEAFLPAALLPDAYRFTDDQQVYGDPRKACEFIRALIEVLRDKARQEATT